MEVVKFLVNNGGADINSRTGRTKQGSSPLNLALEHLNGGHAVTKFLLSNGALDHRFEEEL